jgi:Fur family transcriptional regulator, peroxide stress response regulator
LCAAVGLGKQETVDDLCQLWYDFFFVILSRESLAKTSLGRGTVSDPKARFQQLVDKVRQRGGRLTPQRVAILRILAASEDHPSVEQIYTQIKDDFPTTGMATIYKTVTLLKEMDEVLELGFADGSNRYDGNRSYPHPHLICTQCGEILDLDVPGLDALITQIAEQTAQEIDYHIHSHRLDLYGTCRKCQEAGAQASHTE